MIWAALGVLFASLLLGGGSDPGVAHIDAIESRVSTHVKDDVRRKAAVEVLAGMRTAREKLMEKIEDLASGFQEKYSAHGTSRAEIEGLLDGIDQVRSATWKAQVESRTKLKGSLTRDEWALVFPAPR
jgi:hypothetical protein